MKKFSRVFAAVICSVSLIISPMASMGVLADEVDWIVDPNKGLENLIVPEEEHPGISVSAEPEEQFDQSDYEESDTFVSYFAEALDSDLDLLPPSDKLIETATSSPLIPLTPAPGDIVASAADVTELTSKIQNLKQTQFNAGIALDSSVEAVYTNLLYVFALTKPKTCRAMLKTLEKTATVNTKLYLNIVNSLVGLATGNTVVEVPEGTPVLNKDMGVNYYGPSGKEHYYNMDMSFIVKRINSFGYKGKYWVREDGVKMIGDYVMCAASFDVHPYGSLVQTSLGVAMVVDTGGFVDDNPLSFDIATAW